MTTKKYLVAGLATCAFGACDQNQSGNIGATKTGDITHPATRGSPLVDLQAACNAPGAMLAPTTIKRDPYLQQLTGTDGLIGMVSTSTTPLSVEITSTDGTPVMSSVAEKDSVALRFAGEHQQWSVVSQLQPDTIYCYRVLDDAQPVTERIGFRTAPAADSTRTIGILAFGDSGFGTDDQMALRKEMEDVPYQLMIHTGDLAYDTGSIDSLEDNVFAVYKDLFRHIPFYPASGNHDYATNSGAPFRDVFRLPENGNQERWYSYDWGRIHFAALDTEADYKTQVQWLAQDLAASPLPWKIVYMHRPPYSSGNHGSDTGLRNLLAPVLEQNHVQLLLSGHDHDYERMTPQNGVQYIVTGGGGRGTYAVGESSFTAFSESVIHYVYLEVGVDSATLHAIDAQGTEFDSVVVPR